MPFVLAWLILFTATALSWLVRQKMLRHCLKLNKIEEHSPNLTKTTPNHLKSILDLEQTYPNYHPSVHAQPKDKSAVQTLV
jgi:hypothetical protein